MAATDEQQPPLEVDQSETDSAVGDDISTYTQSLQSSVVKGLKEHGRQYHAYSADNKYLLPEDEDEQDRLDLQHSAFVRLFDGKLLLAPVDTAQEVLDLGTGTGIWAIEYADKHAESNIVGTDLSPIQPTLVPPNCKFVVDDFEKDWLFDKKFDLVHGRLLNTTMSDPKVVFQKAYDALNPGGWFEIQDLVLPTRSDDDSIPPDSGYQRWIDLAVKAVKEGLRRDWSWPEKYAEWLKEIGFEGVQEIKFKWPQNGWPKDEKFKLLGKINLVNTLVGLEGFSYRPFCGLLGMSKEEVNVLLVGMRKDLRDAKIHAYWPIVVVYGQKPAAAASTE